MRTFLIAAFLLFLPVHAYAWPARIFEVTDGDTLIVEPRIGGDRIMIRLWGIDEPERNQPGGGQLARDYVVKAALYRSTRSWTYRRRRNGGIDTGTVYYPPAGRRKLTSRSVGGGVGLGMASVLSEL